MTFFLSFFTAFILGSIPWGLIISKVFYNKDLREEGSGNIGTTNAIRSMGKFGGYIVFVLDFAKGLLSGVLSLYFAHLFGLDLYGEHLASAFAFLGCVWGHIFSPWLKFKGGKGIAVAIGCLFITFGFVGACTELAIFIVVVCATRYVSAGSLSSAIACPFIALWLLWGIWPAIGLCSLAALSVIWSHRGNIVRLQAGNESKIKTRKAKG